MQTDSTLTPGEVRRLFTYDPETGELWWAVGKRGRQRGKPVGCKKESDYLAFYIGPRKLYVHRVVFCWMLGRWPEQVDHKNLDRGDNRWSNLREATSGQNKMNRMKRRDNTSGFKGIGWHKKNRRWRARIKAGGKCYELGCYASKEEAHAAYCKAAVILHGEFARLA